MKWGEVKGIWSTEEIEYFQEQGMESDKWSEMKRIEGNLKWSEDKVNGAKGRVKAGWDVKCI